MRCVAALPSIALLTGAASGLLVPDPPVAPVAVALTVASCAAVWAWTVERDRVLLLAVACAFFGGGVLLSAEAWQRAWRPPLRILFDELARAERVEAAREGRRLPDDPEAFAIVEGTLRADASPTPTGVSLSLAVDRVVTHEGGSACGHAERGPVKPERGISEGTRWGWGPSASGKKLAVCGGLQVTVVGSLAADRVDAWRAGRRVRLPVRLRRPSRYLNPGVPDFERALARRGTTLVGTAKSAALVDLIAPGPLWDEALGAVRAFARRAIAMHVGRWSAQSAAIVAAIVIGDRAGLDDEVQRRLQEAGTYHVIAISGGNIAILAGVLTGAFRVAGWLGRAAMLVAVALLIVYARFVGDGASVDRATLMAVVYLGARAFDQRSPPLNALAVVSAVLVAVDPLSIVDPAFLLTFGATLAILIVVPALATSTPSSRRAVARLLAIVRATFVATMAVEAVLFPIGAFVFSRVTFAGLALNFAAIPLMTLAQMAGLVLVPAALISQPLAASIGWVAHAGASGLVSSADLVRFVPAITYRLAAPSPAICGVYYLGLAVAWIAWQWRSTRTGSAEGPVARRIRLASAAVSALAAAWILVDPRTIAAARGDGRLHVTFIDVGQGDSAFVVFPRGSTLLVDAGGLSFASSFDIGDRVVAPVVREAGFRRLGGLVLTHGDPDHIGGAASILRELRPHEVWEGIPVPRSAALTTLRMAAQAAGARWANVYAGDRVEIDGVEVMARHPLRADWERQKVRNDDSLVLDLRWHEVAILMTGDIGREPERMVASAIPPAPLRVLKIAHHGSLTSSTTAFVNNFRPHVAVVSVGRSNTFGHPVPEVIERYRAIGAEVFRTDRDGAVTVVTDGYSLVAKTFTGVRSEPSAPQKRSSAWQNASPATLLMPWRSGQAWPLAEVAVDAFWSSYVDTPTSRFADPMVRTARR